MNLLGKLQSGYEQLWKQVVRPPRANYTEDSLGPVAFTLEGQQVLRQDFDLTNSRGLTFTCSIWVPSQVDTLNCVIYLHGATGNRAQGMEYLGKLMQQKMGLCTFDFTGSGNAQGQYVSLGYYEQQDLRMVVEHLRDTFNIHGLALWGRGMGAVTALLYLNKTIEVQAAVFDSPYTSAKDLIQDVTLKNSKIPSLLQKGALKMIATTIEEKAQFNISNVNPCKYSAPGLYCPAFFLASQDDPQLPPHHTKEIFTVYASPNKEIKIAKGKNTESRSEEVVVEVIEFLSNSLSQDWKQEIKNYPPPSAIKHEDILDMEYGKQEAPKKQEVDFFAEGVAQEPETVQEPIRRQEVKKATDFSLGGLFSFFGGRNQAKNSDQNRPQPEDGYHQTRKILSKTFTQVSTRQLQVAKTEQALRQRRVRDQGKVEGYTSADLRQWTYCAI